MTHSSTSKRSASAPAVMETQANTSSSVSTTAMVGAVTESVMTPSWDDLLGTVAIVDAAHPGPGESHLTPSSDLPPSSAVPAPHLSRATNEVESDKLADEPELRIDATAQPGLNTESPAATAPAPTTDAPAPTTDAPDVTQPSHVHQASAAAHVPMRSGLDKPKTHFRAAWEVDVLDVPTAVADLFFEASLFDDLSTRLAEAVAGGLRNLLVTSVSGGEGRTTVAIGMALAAAASGLRVALLDGDANHPDLMDQLRLEMDQGWTASLRSATPLSEAAVYSVEDKITLFPLLHQDGDAPLGAEEVIQLMEQLSDLFDLVVVDGPAASDGMLSRVVATIDSAVIVRDLTRTKPEGLNAYSRRLRECGVKGVGIVENFASN
ncbi:MAG: cellulose synthase operon protein YhjQ/BcsQ [Planctomycetota bacterium]